MKHTMNMKLMIPGPVEVTDEVLEAMGSPVLAHYGPEWTALYNETTTLLQRVFQTEGDVFIFGGSGSAGIDACIGSSLASGEKILVGVNGFFGQRVGHIAAAYGLQVVPVESPWGEPLRPAVVADALRRHADARAVAVVHLETSTTIANPVDEIGAIVGRSHIPFIVDAVSSLGGLPLAMDEWGIDLCASASQKCLGAPPGLSPVAVGPGGWEAIDRMDKPGHGWYLNLRTWRQYVEEWGHFHPFPTTQATSNVVALKVSLEQLLAEGIAQRLQRYREVALFLREQLRQIGFEPFTPDEWLVPVLTAAYGPPGVPTGEIVDYVAREHNIKIAGGLGEPLLDKIIRIGHMSPLVSEADIEQVVHTLERFVATH